ncbi:MAG: hypothetical protein IPJ51_11090 [Saprospiraceae bacterium]|nr:hypothetical protein [Saprospiraceae bacterium]
MPDPKLGKLYDVLSQKDPSVVAGLDRENFITKFSGDKNMRKLYEGLKQKRPEFVSGVDADAFVGKFKEAGFWDKIGVGLGTGKVPGKEEEKLAPSMNFAEKTVAGMLGSTAEANAAYEQDLQRQTGEYSKELADAEAAIRDPNSSMPIKQDAYNKYKTAAEKLADKSKALLSDFDKFDEAKFETTLNTVKALQKQLNATSDPLTKQQIQDKLSPHMEYLSTLEQSDNFKNYVKANEALNRSRSLRNALFPEAIKEEAETKAKQTAIDKESQATEESGGIISNVTEHLRNLNVDVAQSLFNVANSLEGMVSPITNKLFSKEAQAEYRAKRLATVDSVNNYLDSYKPSDLKGSYKEEYVPLANGKSIVYDNGQVTYGRDKNGYMYEPTEQEIAEAELAKESKGVKNRRNTKVLGANFQKVVVDLATQIALGRGMGALGVNSATMSTSIPTALQSFGEYYTEAIRAGEDDTTAYASAAAKSVSDALLENIGGLESKLLGKGVGQPILNRAKADVRKKFLEGTIGAKDLLGEYSKYVMSKAGESVKQGVGEVFEEVLQGVGQDALDNAILGSDIDIVNKQIKGFEETALLSFGVGAGASSIKEFATVNTDFKKNIHVNALNQMILDRGNLDNILNSANVTDERRAAVKAQVNYVTNELEARGISDNIQATGLAKLKWDWEYALQEKEADGNMSDTAKAKYTDKIKEIDTALDELAKEKTTSSETGDTTEAAEPDTMGGTATNTEGTVEPDATTTPLSDDELAAQAAAKQAAQDLFGEDAAEDTPEEDTSIERSVAQRVLLSDVIGDSLFEDANGNVGTIDITEEGEVEFSYGNNVVKLGNTSDLGDASVAELGLTPKRVDGEDSGKVFSIGDTKYVVDDPSAVTYDKDGKVESVRALRVEDGKTVAVELRGPEAQEIAYRVKLKELYDRDGEENTKSRIAEAVGQLEEVSGDADVAEVEDTKQTRRELPGTSYTTENGRTYTIDSYDKKGNVKFQYEDHNGKTVKGTWDKAEFEGFIADGTLTKSKGNPAPKITSTPAKGKSTTTTAEPVTEKTVSEAKVASPKKVAAIGRMTIKKGDRVTVRDKEGNVIKRNVEVLEVSPDKKTVKTEFKGKFSVVPIEQIENLDAKSITNAYKEAKKNNTDPELVEAVEALAPKQKTKEKTKEAAKESKKESIGEVTEEEFVAFKNTGLVSPKRLKSIAAKQDAGEALTEKEKTIAEKKQKDIDKINAKYDAELKALEQQPTPKVEAGSVGVGGDVKLEKGNKIQWNVFGNEESGEWTVGEKTKTRGGKDAVVLTKVYVESSSDGRSYTKEYADANGIKYDNERTVEHIVPLEDLQSLKETPKAGSVGVGGDVEAKKADIERRSGLNGVEEIIFSNPNFRLEGFEIEGNYWNVVTSTDRAKVLVNINGVIVPFYLTTGQAGKGLVPGWYPFFGIGKDGWLNKTDKSDMETYYERYWGKETADIVKSISEELNSFYGSDPSTFKNDGDPNATSRPLTTLADKVEDYINSKLNYTPAINNADARKTLRNNVEQLGKEINDKYDAELAAPQVSTDKKADIEKRRQAAAPKEKTKEQLEKEERQRQYEEDLAAAKERAANAPPPPPVVEAPTITVEPTTAKTESPKAPKPKVDTVVKATVKGSSKKSITKFDLRHLQRLHAAGVKFTTKAARSGGLITANVGDVLMNKDGVFFTVQDVSGGRVTGKLSYVNDKGFVSENRNPTDVRVVDISDIDFPTDTSFDIDKQVEQVTKALGKIVPGLTVNVLSDAEYKAKFKDNSRGKYQRKDGKVTITINRDTAKDNTVFHEAAHAVFVHYYGTKSKDIHIIHRTIREALNTSLYPEEQELAKQLDKFIERDPEDIKPHEYLAELVGFLSANRTKLTGTTVGERMVEYLNNMFEKLLGIRPFTAGSDINSIIKLVNNIAVNLAEGQVIEDTIEAAKDTDVELDYSQKEISSQLKTSQSVAEKELLDRQIPSNARTVKLTRLSKSEESGRSQSGKINAEATIITSGVHEAITREQGISNPNAYAKTKQLEEQELIQYALKNDLMLPLPQGEIVDSGNESDIYLGSNLNTLVKVNNANNNNSWLELLDGIAIHNSENPSTPYTITGFTKNADGEFSIVLEQNRIVGKPAEFNKIHKHLIKSGFKVYGNEGDGVYLHKGKGIILEDVKEANVIEDGLGNLHFIDTDYYPYVPYKGGSRKVELVKAPATKAAEPPKVTPQKQLTLFNTLFGKEKGEATNRLVNRIKKNIAKRLGISVNEYNERLVWAAVKSIPTSVNELINSIGGLMAQRDLQEAKVLYQEELLAVNNTYTPSKAMLAKVEGMTEKDVWLAKLIETYQPLRDFINRNYSVQVDQSARERVNTLQAKLATLVKDGKKDSAEFADTKEELEDYKSVIAQEKKGRVNMAAVKTFIASELSSISNIAENSDNYYIKEFPQNVIDDRIDQYKNKDYNPDELLRWEAMLDPQVRADTVAANATAQKADLKGIITYLNNGEYSPEFALYLLNDILAYDYYTKDGNVHKRPRKNDTINSFNLVSPMVVGGMYRDHNSNSQKSAYLEYLSVKKTVKNVDKVFLEDYAKYKVADTRDGFWVKFDKGNEEHYSDLHAAAATTQGTGDWCTGSSLGTATAHLNGGDFYIHLNKEGKATLAIRYEEDRIGEEPRGLLDGQNVRPEDSDILSDFLLNTAPNGTDFIDTVTQNKLIKRFLDNGKQPLMDLTKEEFIFIDTKVKRRGYKEDPNVDALVSSLTREVAAKSFGIDISQVVSKVEASSIDDKSSIVVVLGKLYIDPYEDESGFINLEYARAVSVSDNSVFTAPKLTDTRRVILAKNSTAILPSLERADSFYAEEASKLVVNNLKSVTTLSAYEYSTINASNLEVIHGQLTVKLGANINFPKLHTADYCEFFT